MDIECLEGNSLTESETKVLLEDGLTVGGKPLRDLFEAVDRAKAYDFMFSALQNRCIDEYTVLRMHELFYQNVEPDYAGRYRKYAGDYYRFPLPCDCAGEDRRGDGAAV